jgi:hypothetical protein
MPDGDIDSETGEVKRAKIEARGLLDMLIVGDADDTK